MKKPHSLEQGHDGAMLTLHRTMSKLTSIAKRVPAFVIFDAVPAVRRAAHDFVLIGMLNLQP